MSYRATREHIERDTRALATSVDGVTFQFQASLHGLPSSAAATSCSRATTAPGWARSPRSPPTRPRSTWGSGAAAPRPCRSGSPAARGWSSTGSGRPSTTRRVRLAEPEEVAAVLRRRDEPRPGRAHHRRAVPRPGRPAVLDSGGFNRHTFMCGQSGSGKTYSLGLLLERVLAETELRVVILDPNSDYVGLGRVRPGADRGRRERYRGVPGQVAVWGNDERADHRLRLRFAELDTAAQAAILGLDPVRDRDEYAVLAELLRADEGRRAAHLRARPAHRVRRRRAPGSSACEPRTSGVLDWDVWAARPAVDAPGAGRARPPAARSSTWGPWTPPRSSGLVAQAVLSKLWTLRQTRQPCLVVIDEAHNICAADPVDPLGALSTQRTVQIAAEGRKFGLYLLVSTQRPAQGARERRRRSATTLVMMRMNSQADIEDLTSLFSYVPARLVAGLSSFRMGQALVGGKIFPLSGYVRMGARVSEEGGADIPTDWARPRRCTRSPRGGDAAPGGSRRVAA